MKNYLFDAFPILCWLQQESGTETVESMLDEAETGQIALLMNIINLGEVYYRICRIASAKKADEIIQKLKILPLKIISVSDIMVMEAAKIKGRFPISYADAFAVATAIRHNAPIVTSDPEYHSVSKMIEIRWLK